MPRTYCTVSIYGDTGIALTKFLSEHTEYPTILSFIDGAVNEKMARETTKELPKQIGMEAL